MGVRKASKIYDPRHGRDDRAARHGDRPTGCAWRRAGERKILKSISCGDGGACLDLGDGDFVVLFEAKALASALIADMDEPPSAAADGLIAFWSTV